MAEIASLRPLPTQEFGYLQARHLLNRAGFGGTPRQIAALQAMGLDRAVDHLVDYDNVDAGDLAAPQYDPDLIRPPTAEERELLRKAREAGDEAARDRFRREFLRRQGEDRQQMARLEQWWLARMMATPRPLQEKLVLLWHGHFATNHRTINDSYLILKQNDLFRRHANGSFADLVQGIIRDPAMIRFLNNDSNNRLRPNENLARELMELFTLGEGNYSEADIKEGARALTGYGVEDNEFRFRPFLHDDGEKAILGRRDNFDGEGFARLLLGRKECAIWACYKLYRHFVADLDDGVSDAARAVIHELADDLRQGDYQWRPVLRRLFRSRHFYDPAVAGNQIKSPVQLVVGAARTLGVPLGDISLLSDALAMMGQKLFDPPSVAGWHGGRAWINTSTLFVRQNVCAYLLTGKLPFEDGWTRDRLRYDPLFLIADLPRKDPEAAVDQVAATLLPRPLAPGRREELLTYLRQREGGISQDALVGLLLLITAMPEYQMC